MGSTYAELLDEVATPPSFGLRTGVGITPVLCSEQEWGPLQGGLDQVEVAVHLTAEGRRFVESHFVLRPARYGRFLCGTERNGVWTKFLGVSTVYDPKHSTVAYDFHPHGEGEFAPLDGWLEGVSGELNRRATLGLEFEGWAIVKRADVGIDVGFRRPELGRAFYEALRDRRYARGRRVQERQPGWFSILGRGTRKPVQHGRVYDKGVQSRRAGPWTWIRTERVIRWERRDAMRLSLLKPGSLRYSYDEVFLDGLAPGTLVRSNDLGSTLSGLVVSRGLTVRQYEALAGFLLAERAGLVDQLYRGAAGTVSRREALARSFGIVRSGAGTDDETSIDLHAMMHGLRGSISGFG